MRLTVQLTCTLKPRPALPVLPPIPSVPSDGSVHVCTLSELNPTSCCGGYSTITFDSSIVCAEGTDSGCLLEYCQNLITVYIPATMQAISNRFLFRAYYLKSVYIADGITSMGERVNLYYIYYYYYCCCCYYYYYYYYY